MKKEDIAGIVVYTLMLAIAVVFGFTILQSHQVNSGLSGMTYFLYIFGGIVAGLRDGVESCL